MSDSVNFHAFPRCREEALAMLFLQNQDLSGLTPTQIQEEFWKAYNEINRDYKERRDYFKKL